MTAFALGLPAFVGIRVLTAAHLGRGDTVTPMIHGLVAVAVNIALALALRPALGWVAVAWATAAAAWANLALLAAALIRSGHWRFDAESRRRLPRLLAAALAMGAGVAALRPLGVDALLAAPSTSARLAGLGLLVAGGIAVYAGLVVLTRAIDLAALGRARRRDEDVACEDPSDRA